MRLFETQNDLVHVLMLASAICFLAFQLPMTNLQASTDETIAESGLQEHFVEFSNGEVKLAGSLLLPRSEAPVFAVVFVHGAGHNTRNQHREIGEYFASQGIAALIYDKRGTGKSGGVYESSPPYENLVNDALAAVALLNSTIPKSVCGDSARALTSAPPRHRGRKTSSSSTE